FITFCALSKAKGMDIIMKKQRILSKQIVLNKAMDIAENDGIDSLTFQRLSQSLNIKSPSLYNYFKNLDELKIIVGSIFFDNLSSVLYKNLLGLSGKEAIKVFSSTIRDYSLQHPKLAMVILTVHKYEHNSPIYQSLLRVHNILDQLLCFTGKSQTEILILSRSIRSAVLGFIILELSGYFEHKEVTKDASFKAMLDTTISSL
ncbi:TetR/AcrR family transcriptional regulator, partial [Clostridium tyrobutyricum]|uniref:TetR/AcrR family transcriptional regulator n=2 Tax=Clostridium tyrobutyricum TaxID=1519 RepID=UPI0019D70D8B